MRLSNSKIKTWRRCPNKYRYKYVMDLEPRAHRVQLERGTWVHSLLQHHYDGDGWEPRHDELERDFYNLPEEVRVELGDLPDECARIMKAYLRHWRNEDKKLVVVDSEMDEIVTLPNGIQFRVIVDLIVEDSWTKKLFAWDHKTRKNFERSDNMLLDPQLTNYFTALQMMGYEPLGGVCYNEIRTKPPVVPDMLKNGMLSQRKNMDTDVRTYYREIKRHGEDPEDYAEMLRHLARNQEDRFFRRTYLPKDPPMLKQMKKEIVWSAREISRATRTNEYPRTFIPASCKWDCEYKDLCIAELHGADIGSMIKLGFRRRHESDEVSTR